MFDYIAMRKPLVVSRTRSVLQTLAPLASSCSTLMTLRTSHAPSEPCIPMRSGDNGWSGAPPRSQSLTAGRTSERFYRNMVERLLEPHRPAALKNWSTHIS